MAIQVFLYGDLSIFLPKGQRHLNYLEIELTRRTSIKDFVESLGIPHPEINKLLVNDRAEGFEYIVMENDRIEVLPLSAPGNSSLLRPTIEEFRFAVDANVGKLARLLRMAGFDVFFSPDLDDRELAEITEQQERLLLTRDVALLKRKCVVHGRLVRNNDPRKQLGEIFDLYDLRSQLKPFSRCLCCNAMLKKVSKKEVVGRLQPLTKKHYHEFMVCPDCDRLYWPGSHREKMNKILEEI